VRIEVDPGGLELPGFDSVEREIAFAIPLQAGARASARGIHPFG
jgi:hypothetical protein